MTRGLRNQKNEAASVSCGEGSGAQRTSNVRRAGGGERAWKEAQQTVLAGSIWATGDAEMVVEPPEKEAVAADQGLRGMVCATQSCEPGFTPTPLFVGRI